MAGAANSTYAIHPALGIARMGNAVASPDDPSTWYLGAESPYEVPNKGQPYKIGTQVKKQAQRFRIYEFQDGQALREITLQQSDVAGIEWTVHLANRKAALHTDLPPGTVSKPAAVPPPVYGPPASNGWKPDQGKYDASYWPAQTRNASVSPGQRARLCIDAGPQTVVGNAGTNGETKNLVGTITFPRPNRPPVSKSVMLGSLSTEDRTGRLLVFGGNGLSEGILEGEFSPHAHVDEWGNNDGWHDDTSDGWVLAKITFRDGTVVRLDQPEQRAWVISTAPRYAPWFNNFTTLYDSAVNAVFPPTASLPRPSFARDVYPILRCASLLTWLSARASAGHGPGRPAFYLTQDRLRLMSDNNPSPTSDAYKARNGVFVRVRDPNKPVHVDGVQQFMPQVPNELTEKEDREPFDAAVFTRRQYALLQKWRDGDFDADGVPQYVPLEQLDVKLQPDALDRAALEGTTGSPYYPGIESWRIMKPAALFVPGKPLRMRANTQPGDLTIGNALPWQADFLDCNDVWWPVQRPNEVTRNGKPLQWWVPVAWRPNEDYSDYSAIVTGWWELGFIVTKDNGTTFVEDEGTADYGS
jgi:hypothetical protein